MNKISILLKSLLYNKYKFNQKFDFKTNNNYLVTTELGIIYISSKKFRFLTRFPGYGLTVNKNTVYFSYEDGKWEKKKYKTFSRVISAQLSDLINGKFLCKSTLYNQEEIYIQFFSSNNGRIHQVSYSPENNGKDHIIISASNENCIVKYNLYSKKYTKIFPFLDKFDVPIKNFDHNHINSAIKIGNTIYFVAYKAGSSSLIGYLKDAHVYGWQVYPKGFHDFYPTTTGFLSCDTFGNAEHGRVLSEQGYLCPDFFKKNDLAPRGIAGDEQELLIGHSHKGPRSKRFKGRGGLIAVKSGKEPEYIQLPAAQVYQIVRENGEYFVPLDSCNHEKMKEMLDCRFGPAIHIGKYTEESVHHN
jgi:hypothetical protein